MLLENKVAVIYTGRAAARHMIPRGSGVILAFGGNGPQTLPGLGGFKVALDAIEGLRRQWACELGTHGIRVVILADVGHVAAFLASDLARTITATEINISCGALVD